MEPNTVFRSEEELLQLAENAKYCVLCCNKKLYPCKSLLKRHIFSSHYNHRVQFNGIFCVLCKGGCLGHTPKLIYATHYHCPFCEKKYDRGYRLSQHIDRHRRTFSRNYNDEELQYLNLLEPPRLEDVTSWVWDSNLCHALLLLVLSQKARLKTHSHLVEILKEISFTLNERGFPVTYDDVNENWSKLIAKYKEELFSPTVTWEHYHEIQELLQDLAVDLLNTEPVCITRSNGAESELQIPEQSIIELFDKRASLAMSQVANEHTSDIEHGPDQNSLYEGKYKAWSLLKEIDWNVKRQRNAQLRDIGSSIASIAQEQEQLITALDAIAVKICKKY